MTQTAAASLADVDVTLMLFEPAGPFTESGTEDGGSLASVGARHRHHQQSGPVVPTLPSLEARRRQVEELGVFDKVPDSVCPGRHRLRGAVLHCLRRTAARDPIILTMMPTPICRKRNWWRSLCGKKALLFLREEVPHGIAVTVESFKERPDKDLVDITVDIYCEKKSHKGMIIGKGGQMLKKIASAARVDCEELLGTKVNLQCWVKVREGLA